MYQLLLNNGTVALRGPDDLEVKVIGLGVTPKTDGVGVLLELDEASSDLPELSLELPPATANSLALALGACAINNGGSHAE